jgi:hypothetical protein
MMQAEGQAFLVSAQAGHSRTLFSKAIYDTRRQRGTVRVH